MAERNTLSKGQANSIPAKLAATKVEAGNMVAANSTGYGIHAADSVNYKVLGVADETVDNSAGNAGDLSAIIRRNEAFYMKNDGASPVAQANVGGNVYVKDSVTVSSGGGTNNIVAGKCLALDVTLGVLVWFG